MWMSIFYTVHLFVSKSRIIDRFEAIPRYIFHFHCFVLLYLLLYYELQHIYGPVSYMLCHKNDNVISHRMRNMHTNISRFYWCVNRLIVWSLIGIVWLNHLSSFLIYDLEKSYPKNVILILLIYSKFEHTKKKLIFPNHLAHSERAINILFMLKSSTTAI